ncbi:hypothetical protein HOY82DRAFT_639382 [Tuber indicum]|nr:hypothetical protein HOY82DRAFT_639382 [Tuber indicum]
MPRTAPRPIWVVRNGARAGSTYKIPPRARVTAGPPRVKPSPPRPITNTTYYSYTTIAQAQAYHQQLPVASDHLEALVCCQLRQDKNSDRERMLVVNALKRATKNVEKTPYITGSQCSYYAYVNGGGGRILAEITQLQKASEDQAVKLDSLKKKYSAKLEASGKELSAKLEALEKELSNRAESAATMKPIQEVGISIHKRFFIIT